VYTRGRLTCAGSVASSVLSPPPELLSAGDVTLTEITPRTAARIAQLGPTQATVASAGDLLDPSAPADGRKAKRVRLIRADADIELPDAYFAHPGPDAPVWAAEAHFIPSDPADVALQTLFANPGDYFLPVTDAPQGQGGGKVLYAGPIGLADELKELFTFPVNLLRRDREDEGDAALGPNKRQKVQGQDEPEEEQQGQGENDDEDVEIARRQSVLAPELLDNEGYPGAEGMDDSFALADDPLAFDIPQTPRKAPTERYPSLAPSRAESMARQIQYSGDQGEFALAMFDNRTSAGAAGASDSLQSQSQQQTPTKSSVAASEARTHGGYSKNTGMAMGLLRRELEVIEAEVQAEEKVVRMNELADKVSSPLTAFVCEMHW
jgi:cohesin complex subunit SCC1